MSTDNKTLDDSKFHEEIKKKSDFAQKKQDVEAKALIVREREVDVKLERLQQADKNLEIAKNVDYSRTTDQDIERIQKDNTEYIQAARSKMPFLNEEFSKIIPFFRKNLILIGSETGYGKSTTAANLIASTIQRMGSNNKRRRVLVITNEERPEDVYNRVTCIIKGWEYKHHDQFTDDQIKTFNEYIKNFSKTGLITVIDDSFSGTSGSTTTLEGICTIFDDLIKRQQYYDVVILDYYQKVQESIKNPLMNEWMVQAILGNRLDSYKNLYPAPIVVFAQLKPSETEGMPFKSRIEGRKAILNAATCCVEIIPNREELTTDWVIHKNRFNGQSVGQKIKSGYMRGRFVECGNPAYQEMVAKMKAQRDELALQEAIEAGNKNIIPMTAEKKDE
jgi:DnaB-like helicase C terminal domain